MKNLKNLSFRSRTGRFRHAFNGLKLLFGKEPNAQVHLIATAMVILAGFLRHLSPSKWLAIVVAIGLVLVTETLNTCIEKLCDFACNNERHPAIKTIKDMAAGAVLIAAITSVAIACIVFFF